MRICFIFFRFSILQHKRHRAKNQQLFSNREFRTLQFIKFVSFFFSFYESLLNIYIRAKRRIFFLFTFFCKIIQTNINIFLNWYKFRSKKQLLLIVFIFEHSIKLNDRWKRTSHHFIVFFSFKFNHVFFNNCLI